MADIQHLKIFFILFAILMLLNCCNCVKRKIQLQKYDKCKSDKVNVTIVYVTATDNEKKNTVHFMWSVYDTPSIIVGYTSKFNFHPNPKLIIDCKKLLNSDDTEGAITLKDFKFDYVSAFEVSEVEELHDPDDNVIFKPKDFGKTIKHKISDVVWSNPTSLKDEVSFKGNFLGGSIVFTFNSSSEDGRGAEAPRQLYTNNGTRFSITLEKMKFNTTNTRVALKVLSHTEKAHDKTPNISEHSSIDDEFSPGVFRTFVISHVINSTLSSFVSWKPVSYVNSKKALGSQGPSYQYKYEDVDEYKRYEEEQLVPLVKSSDKPSRLIQAAMAVHETFPVMVSFGQKKDGWYQKREYLTWSGQVGYGKPQFDSISKTLYITIFVGLGLPVAFILAGSFYVCFKKYRERRTASSYGKIN